MSLYPGRRYVGDSVRLAVNVQNEDGTDIDPATDVQLRTKSPRGTTATYTYTGGDITREDTGDYYIEIVPDRAGRWYYEWATTGSNAARIQQSSFIVKWNPWDSTGSSSDYGAL